MKEELIFAIFTTLAEEAMGKGMHIDLSYENTQSDSQTIVSKSKRDFDDLLMNIWQAEISKDDEEDPEEEDDEEDTAY